MQHCRRSAPHTRNRKSYISFAALSLDDDLKRRHVNTGRLAEKSDYAMMTEDLLGKAFRTVGDDIIPFEQDRDFKRGLRAPLFALAILSQKRDAVQWTAKFVKKHVTDKVQVRITAAKAQCLGIKRVLFAPT